METTIWIKEREKEREGEKERERKRERDIKGNREREGNSLQKKKKATGPFLCCYDQRQFLEFCKNNETSNSFVILGAFIWLWVRRSFNEKASKTKLCVRKVICIL